MVWNIPQVSNSSSLIWIAWGAIIIYFTLKDWVGSVIKSPVTPRNLTKGHKNQQVSAVTTKVCEYKYQQADALVCICQFTIYTSQYNWWVKWSGKTRTQCQPQESLGHHLILLFCFLFSREDFQRIPELAINPLGDRIINAFFPEG